MSIKCKECSKEFKNKIQFRHLKTDHNMTVAEYEIKHGQGSTDVNFNINNIPTEQRIECRECGWVFSNTITHAHLKRHNMTIEEYQQKYGKHSHITEYYQNSKSSKYKGDKNPNYGNKWSDEQKSHLSDIKKKGYEDGVYIAHNKNVPMSDDQKRLISKIKKEGFENGTYTAPFKGRQHTEENRKLLSERQQEYARNNPDEMSDRAKKAYKTRHKQGTVFSFSGHTHTDLTKEFLGQQSRLFAANNRDVIERKAKQAYLTRVLNNNPFSFKGHTLSDEAKASIALKSKEFWSKESSVRVERMKEFIHTEGYMVIDMDEDSSKGYITFICNCGSERQHTCTKQLFYPSKYEEYNGMCRFCDTQSRSRAEQELVNWIESLGVTVHANDRSTIFPKELDIMLPDYNLAIEFNGLYWHSELMGKTRNYHTIKMKECNDKGIKLIQIFEDEWIDKPELIKSMIKKQLGMLDTRLFARKTTVRQISPAIAKEFVNENHISGYHKCSMKLGLFNGEELVSVMTFSTGNYSRKSMGWEIDRFCTKAGYQIVGGASKLFKAFIRLVNPDEVISYADLRYGSGGVYEKLGFVYSHDTKPNYWYFKNTTILQRYHRFGLRKGVVDGDDPLLTEWENRVNQGWNRIWDCGSRKYVWTQNE